MLFCNCSFCARDRLVSCALVTVIQMGAPSGSVPGSRPVEWLTGNYFAPEVCFWQLPVQCVLGVPPERMVTARSCLGRLGQPFKRFARIRAPAGLHF